MTRRHETPFLAWLPAAVLVLATALVPVEGPLGPLSLEAQETPQPTAPRAAARGMVPEDYFRLTFVSEPRISPDGSEVVFVVRRVSDDRRSREGALWIAPTDGSAPPRALTTGTRDRHPRWAPNGSRLAYLDSAPGPEGASGDDAEADAGTRLRIVPREGGEAHVALHLRQGSVEDFTWTRDGRIVLSLSLDPGVSDPRQPPPADDPATPDRTVITDAVYKAEGTGLLGPERVHLWIFDPGVESLSRVTTGDPRWNDRDAVVSPDGRAVAFQRDGSGEEYDGAFDRDLWVVDLAASPAGEPRALGLAPGRAGSPTWSPDGESLLYRFEPGRYARAHLQVAEVDGSAPSPRTLTLDVDLAPTDFLWHPSGRHLFFTADHRGTRPLYRVERERGRRPPPLRRGRHRVAPPPFRPTACRSPSSTRTR
jgi:dipeptidyl aminopeptidase/acylaminoacyl peptidase